MISFLATQPPFNDRIYHGSTPKPRNDISTGQEQGSKEFKQNQFKRIKNKVKYLCGNNKL